jgi:hypothetical protein
VDDHPGDVAEVSSAVHADEINSPAVIAGLDPAIPMIWHDRALLSGMAGSSPAMTIPLESDEL